MVAGTGGEFIQRRGGVPGQVDRGAFAGEGTRHGATDRTGRTIDDGDLVSEQHRPTLYAVRREPPGRLVTSAPRSAAQFGCGWRRRAWST
jgi:hypothetical protein